MNSVFLVGYYALAGLVFCEAMAAHAIYRQIVSHQRVLERRLKNGWNGVPLLSEVPAFRTLDLRSGTPVVSSDFKGRAAVFVFVSVQMPMSLISWVLTATRSRLPGELHLVCDGSPPSCVALSRQIETEIGTVLWDEDGRLTHKFGIQSKPSVVAVDSAGCVRKAGSLTIRNATQAPAKRLGHDA